MFRLSYANVASTLALGVALSTGAYAATTLPRHSVGTDQLKNDAVTSKKVKNGGLAITDLAPGTAVAPGDGVRTANKQLDPCNENIVLSLKINPVHRSRLLGITAGNWHANQASEDNDYEVVSNLQLKQNGLIVGKTASLSNESLGGSAVGEDARQPLGSSGVLLNPKNWKATVLRPGKTYTLELVAHTYADPCANNPLIETAQLSYVLLSNRG